MGWKDKVKHVMVPSTTVEETYLDDLPRLGTCFCRGSKFPITIPTQLN